MGKWAIHIRNSIRCGLKRRSLQFRFVWVLVLPLLSLAYAQSAPVASTLPTAAPTQAWDKIGSGTSFVKDYMTEISEAARNLEEVQKIPATLSVFFVDPTQLVLSEETDVRVHFIAAKAGPPMGLGINYMGTGVDEGYPQMVFPEMRPRMDYQSFVRGAKNTEFQREGAFPLLPGDTVELGKLGPGTALNFFLCNAEGEPTDVYTGVPGKNPDEKDCMIAIAVPETSMLIIGFGSPHGIVVENYFDYLVAVHVNGRDITRWFDNYSVGSPFDRQWSLRDAAILTALWVLRLIRRYGLPVIIIAIIFGIFFAWRSFIAMRRLRRKRKADTYFKQATEALETRPAEEVMVLVRQGRPLDRGTKRITRWNTLVTKASAASKDYSSLLDSIEEAKAVFQDNEPISIMAAHAAAELGRQELFGELHHLWNERSTRQVAWNTLQADLFYTNHSFHQAQMTLLQDETPISNEPAVLARIACIRHREDPAAGWAIFNTIQQHTAETHRFRARMLRNENKIQEADQAYRMALQRYESTMQGAPSDVFLMDEVAEFYRGQGHLQNAIALWSKMLSPSTPSTLWAKILFWSRIYGFNLENATTENMPNTAMRPLLDVLMKWPPDTFWDERAMSTFMGQHPAQGSWQSIFWLRMIDLLSNAKEGSALAQMNLSRPGERSWEPALELGLHCVLTYRRSGMIPPELAESMGALKNGGSPSTIKVLQLLNDNGAASLMAQMDIYPRLFEAAGWPAAAQYIFAALHKE